RCAGVARATHMAFADGKKNGLEESAHFPVRQRRRNSTPARRAAARAGAARAGPCENPRLSAQAPLRRPVMGFLAGKRLLITGVLNNRSIAYGVARACHREGAELAFSYQGERFKERVTEFAAEFGSKLVFDCDVGSDEQIAALFADLAQAWPEGFDGFLHSIGFAPRAATAGASLEGLSREGFRIAHDISAYSFPAMAKAEMSCAMRKPSRDRPSRKS